MKQTCPKQHDSLSAPKKMGLRNQDWWFEIIVSENILGPKMRLVLKNFHGRILSSVLEPSNQRRGHPVSVTIQHNPRLHRHHRNFMGTHQ
jgi:hypothetical protein